MKINSFFQDFNNFWDSYYREYLDFFDFYVKNERIFIENSIKEIEGKKENYINQLKKIKDFKPFILPNFQKDRFLVGICKAWKNQKKSVRFLCEEVYKEDEKTLRKIKEILKNKNYPKNNNNEIIIKEKIKSNENFSFDNEKKLIEELTVKNKEIYKEDEDLLEFVKDFEQKKTAENSFSLKLSEELSQIHVENNTENISCELFQNISEEGNKKVLYEQKNKLLKLLPEIDFQIQKNYKKNNLLMKENNNYEEGNNFEKKKEENYLKINSNENNKRIYNKDKISLETFSNENNFNKEKLQIYFNDELIKKNNNNEREIIFQEQLNEINIKEKNSPLNFPQENCNEKYLSFGIKKKQ